MGPAPPLPRPAGAYVPLARRVIASMLCSPSGRCITRSSGIMLVSTRRSTTCQPSPSRCSRSTNRRLPLPSTEGRRLPRGSLDDEHVALHGGRGRQPTSTRWLFMNNHVPSIAHMVARSTSTSASTPETTPISASPTVTSGETQARTSVSSSWSIVYDSAVTASTTIARSSSACPDRPCRRSTAVPATQGTDPGPSTPRALSQTPAPVLPYEVVGPAHRSDHLGGTGALLAIGNGCGQHVALRPRLVAVDGDEARTQEVPPRGRLQQCPHSRCRGRLRR